MADRFFSHVLEASEHLSNRLEEGLTVLFPGAGSDSNNNANNNANNNNNGETIHSDGMDHEQFDVADADNDDNFDYLSQNPLQGIAESVMGNIMSNQVSKQAMRVVCKL